MMVRRQTPRIDDLLAELDAAARGSERRFRSIGKQLEAGLDLLAHMHDEFASVQQQWQAADLPDAERNLQESAAQVSELLQVQRQDRAALEQLLQLVVDMPKHAERMRTPIATVGALAVNARLACAAIAHIDGSLFAFADQISQTARQARERLALLDEKLGVLQTECREADAAQADLPEGEAAEALPQRVAAALGDAEVRRGHTAQAAATIQERAIAMQGNIVEAVRGMQVGDITRQRVEHAQDIARMAAELPQGPAASLGWTIAAAQLRDTARELEEAAERIGEALGGLAAEARNLTRMSNAVFGAASGSYLGVLQNEVRQTGAALAALHTAFSAVDQCSDAVQRAGAELAQHIAGLREMEVEIHLTGLNAQVRCMRLGEAGRPLSVIAQWLGDAGREIAVAADRVRTRLAEIAAQSGQLAHTGRRGVLDGIRRLTPGMEGAVEKLATADRSLAGALQRLDVGSRRLSVMLAEAVSAFAVRKEIADVLERVAGRMAAWADATEAAGASAEADCTELLARIGALYTMAREREVQAEVTGIAPPPDPDPADAEADLDAMLL